MNTHIQPHKQTITQTHGRTNKQTNNQASKQTNKHTNTQPNKQTNKQTNTQTHTQRYPCLNLLAPKLCFILSAILENKMNASNELMMPELKKSKFDTNDPADHDRGKENQGVVKARSIPKFDRNQLPKRENKQNSVVVTKSSIKSTAKTKIQPSSKLKSVPSLRSSARKSKRAAAKSKSDQSDNYKATSQKLKTETSTNECKGSKRTRRMPKTVDKFLTKMKIDPKEVSCCLKAAMVKGFVQIKGDVSDLEQVVLEGKYDDHTYKVLVKDVLYQPDYGGNDYCDLADVTVTCVCCDMEKDDYDEGEVFPMFIYQSIYS